MAGKQCQTSLVVRTAPPSENTSSSGQARTFYFGTAKLTYMFLDEPRRSGRPTKGVHTNKMDVDETPEPKKKGGNKKGKKQAVQEEEEVEIIRCVCGARATEGDDDPEPWIACDTCGAWQHNVCMGIPIHDEDIPDNYLCEQCGPHEHQELLESMKRGEEIWVERRKSHERVQAEEASKKKGKKGKAKRQSDLSMTASNGKAKSPAVTVDKKETPARAGSTKRKARDESHESVKVISIVRVF
jgi:hypothetical protein